MPECLQLDPPSGSRYRYIPIAPADISTVTDGAYTSSTIIALAIVLIEQVVSCSGLGMTGSPLAGMEADVSSSNSNVVVTLVV